MKRYALALTLALLSGTFAVVPAHAQKSGKAKSKPQIELASKGAFPIVKASDAKVKSALPATNLAAAKKLVGKTKGVVGTVSKVFAPKSNNFVLLNFAKDYKTALIGLVNFKDYSKFPKLTQLSGKKVLLTGKIVMYKNAPEVLLENAGSISIVK